MTAQRESQHYGTTPEQRAERDTRIRQMTADGCTVAKIAEDLGCDKRTVYNARANDVDLALRREARSIASSMVKFKELIATAKARNIHVEQGFKSWPAYIADVIGKEMPALAATERRQIIALLSGEGMSQRAIAEAVGVSQKTIDRDLRQLSHDDSVDRPSRVMGRDGKSRPARKPPKPPTPPAPTPAPPTATDPDDTEIEAVPSEPLDPRLIAELDKHRAKLDADWAAHVAAYDAQNDRIKAIRDEERRRYQEGIEVQRAKGLITPADYSLIRSCLHPDSRNAVTSDKLATAFRVFNDSRIRTLLVKET